MTQSLSNVKECKRCGVEKPHSEFHKDKSNPDGLYYSCKVCARAKAQAWFEKNREHKQNYERQRRKDGYRAPRRPEYRMVSSAIRSGKLVKPDTCQDCGERCEAAMLHGHHEDYSKPLDVIWLCARCHGRRHRIDIQD